MRRKTTLLFVVLAMVASACSGNDDSAGPEEGPEPDPSSVAPVADPARAGRDRTTGPVSVKLSEGTGTVAVVDPARVVEGSPLDAQSITTVLDRLPEWEQLGSDQVDFNRPAESIPPPIAGDTIDAAWPADGDDPPPEVDNGPLEVLRVQPEGEVGLAPFVSITFNQPMVALGTVAQTDAADVPVTITPELPGRWQWIGTRTLRFEHDPDVFDRLPMATSYVIEVPAGTESATGNGLAETVRVEFETPTPSLRWLTPGGESLDLEPIFVASFDQRVDPDGVIAVTSVLVDGQSVDIRLASDNDIAGDERAADRVERELDGTWVAFRAVDPFPPDAAITVEIGPEIPSAEGPNTNDTVASERMRTYAPLRVERQSCTTADPCQPEWGLWVSFNNSLDGESVDLDEFVFEPEIPGAFVRIRGNDISVEGELVGNTTYTMTVPAGLTDIFGQTLGDDESIEFHIDSAFPFIDAEEGRDLLVTLDPLVDTQTLPIQLRNHDRLRVRAFAVSPADWNDFAAFAELRYYEDGLPEPAWPEIYDQVIDTGAPPDQRFEARIDLEPVFGGDPGMAVVLVEPVGELADLTPRDNRWYENQPVLRWVQSTSLGVDLLTDNDEGIAWATDLRTGDPLAGVDIRLVGDQQTSVTGADGLVRLDLPPAPESGGPLVASLGDDTAITTANVQAWVPGNQALWYVVDDRAIYRPGETMRVKGWVRILDVADDATIEMLPPGETITYLVRDAFRNEIATGEIVLSDTGGFDFAADIPLGANLGFSTIEFRRPATPGLFGYTHQFQIEEFRRPEFEVTTRADTPGPYFVDEPATVAVEAAYFSGGPLPDAEVEWDVDTRTTSYSPPGWEDFTFGTWTPWWIFDDLSFGGGSRTSSERFSGTTDGSGTHFLQMDFEGDGEGQPTTVSATAWVTDVNRQVWSSTTDLLVHASDLYSGLRATRTFVRAGDGLDVEVIVTDIDGAAVAGRAVTIVADRIRNDYVDGEWTDVVIDSETREVTSSDAPETVSFAMDNGGRYRITSTVVDDLGRESRSEMTRWVTGGDALPSRRLELQQATVVPDRMEYAVGDSAEIFVGSPFGPAQGLMTVTRNGFVTVETFEIAGSDTVLEVPIRDEDVPNLRVDIELVGVSDRAADDGTVLPDVPPRPAYAAGSIELRIPPASRTLSVEAVPAADVVEPGSDTSVTVEVTDAAGAPVEDAELLVVAVDEAVLALTGYDLLDPVELFYRPVRAGVGTYRSRDSIRLADPQALVDYARQLREQVEGALEAAVPDEVQEVDMALDGDDMADTGLFAPSTTTVPSARYAVNAAADFDGAGGGAQPIEVRSNFDALAVWAPEVTTGTDGRATVDIDVPDSLTRYRIMVVAVDGVDRFGSAQSNLTARLPLQVRPSAPRFLNFGDDFELPIVVQNLTDDDMDVDVVLQTSNLDIDGSPGRSVTVPANNRIEVRFPVTTESAGTARFRAVAVSTANADAATASLPVYTPATAEAFATYGVVDAGAVIQPLLAPEGVIPQFGGLEINTSSTAVQALTDAVIYLNEYRYDNADGLASRILAVAALRDVLEAFEAEGIPTPGEFDAAVARDISALAGLQNYDGGFATWRRNRPSSPYRSVHVMHALFEAEANGYSVPRGVLDNGREYLRNIESFIPQTWSEESRDTLIAYSLFVRRIDDDIDSAKANQVWQRQGLDFGLDALAWLWPVIGEAAIETEIARNFSNRVTETAQAATFATAFSEDDSLLLRSDRRTDGIILDAMIEMDPDNDLIPKIVAGLIANQRQGRWNNAQENAFILLALNNYFDTFESVTPDFVARVWLGDLYAAEQSFEGRSIDSFETVVPMDELLAIGDDDLVVAKEGDGRLYYRLGLRYAPDDFDLDPLDRGFVVQRTYEAIDDDRDVRLDDDGVWRIAAGANVRVTVTMVNDSRRTNMALIDPLPAGLEALNPALAVTADIPFDEEFGFEGDFGRGFGDDFVGSSVSIGFSRYYGPWWDHQNLRDDRAEAFSASLFAGTHEYSYVARATTPGTFVVPPARAEEIYSPETFGRSASDIVIVE